MAEQLNFLKPKRVLDVGCGTGEGLLALLAAYSPHIISLEENAECIRHATDAIFTNGFPVEPIFRLGYVEHRDGTHDMVHDQTPIAVSKQVSLIHSDLLADDPAVAGFLESQEKFDAITVWLMGTFMMRRTCRNIAPLAVKDGNDYRLRVQNRAYDLAHKVLRPGGVLHIVDRGEPPTTKHLQDDLLAAHRDQASTTDLEVFDLKYREYTEPTERGISMVPSPGKSGRLVELKTLAMLSTMARKPS